MNNEKSRRCVSPARILGTLCYGWKSGSCQKMTQLVAELICTFSVNPLFVHALSLPAIQPRPARWAFRNDACQGISPSKASMLPQEQISSPSCQLVGSEPLHEMPFVPCTQKVPLVQESVPVW